MSPAHVIREWARRERLAISDQHELVFSRRPVSAVAYCPGGPGSPARALAYLVEDELVVFWSRHDLWGPERIDPQRLLRLSADELCPAIPRQREHTDLIVGGNMDPEQNQEGS